MKISKENNNNNNNNNNNTFILVAITILVVAVVIVAIVKFGGGNNNNNTSSNNTVTYDKSVKAIKDYANKAHIDYNNKEINTALDFGKINEIPFKIAFKTENNEQFIDVIINDKKITYFSGAVDESNAIKEFAENTTIEALSDRILLINASSTYNIGNGFLNPSIAMYDNEGKKNEIINVVTDYYKDGVEKKCNIEVSNDKVKYCQYVGTKEPGAVTKVEVIEYDDVEPKVLDSFDANIQAGEKEE